MTSHTEVLEWFDIRADDQMRLLVEFREVSRALDAAYCGVALTCPPEWAVESSTSIALYSLVRTRRPETVVETGIANGHSSFVILSALERNGRGRLASVDVREDTGILVPTSLTKWWTRIIIRSRRPDLPLLSESLAPFAPFGIFFHDGDHRFLGQMLDYKIAADHLAADGIILSDDIDVTSAWLDAAELGLLPSRRLVLLDRRKAVGFAANP